MCSAASQAGMNLGMDGGRLAPLPPSSPCFGSHGLGLGAPVEAVSCRFGFVVPLCQGGACISPHPVLERGGGGALGYRNRYFYTIFLLYYCLVFFFFFLPSLIF